MYTLVIVREPRRRSVFTVRDSAATTVFKSFKREEAKEKQKELNTPKVAVA